MDPDDTVRFAVRDGIARITLDRPARRNAIDVATGNRLTEIWERVDADDSILAAVLDAADCGSFCAGMDLKEMAELRAAGADPLRLMADPFQARMQALSKPVVAALTGHFTGAGLLLAMQADIRVGLAGTTGGAAEVRVGRGTSWAVPLLWMLPQAVVTELLMTGDPVPVETMARHGFVNHLEATAEAVRARALAIAARIAANAPLSVRAAKASLAAGLDLGRAAGLERAAALHEPVYRSADATEGPRAFAERRPPRWTGR